MLQAQDLLIVSGKIDDVEAFADRRREGQCACAQEPYCCLHESA